MQPLISVIVPVYNGELYLKNCIESIEAQSYEPLEIIVINDGSTDGTAEVCEKLAQSYENLSFITTEDLGVAASRNHGIALAKGELLTFVDADDRIHPQMLQRLYEAIEQTESDIAGCRFTIWNTEREWKIAANSVPVSEQTHKVYEKQEYLKDQILCGNSRCWSKLYRKALLEQRHAGRWFREGMTIGEDMLFLMDLLPEAGTIVEIDFHGYGYYQNPQGAMNRTFRPEYMDQIRCWEIAREQVRKLLPECESKATSILLISIMLTVGKLAGLPSGERKQFRGYVKECREKLFKERQDREAMKLLSKGYQFKVRLFAATPGLYLWCYHLRKR
jgi:glycosyltransferase involved in cell wall biosynthesis